MAEVYNHIDELIIKHLRQSLTAAEDALLQQWLQTNPAHQSLFNRINNASNINEALATLYTFNEQQGWNKLTTEYKFTNENEEEAGSSESLVVSMKPKLWKRIAIAASILITIGIAAYVISSQERHPELVSGPNTHDVKAPDRNRAQIKLADGSIIYLDSAANGQLVNTNGITVTKTEDGKIVYSSLTTHDSPLTTSYNTLMNPRGSKVQPLTLSDGTKLWLNAESSVTYPTAFTGNERKVEITGEAYFEVAHNAAKPFIVSKGEMNVKVLGTHFNVNAYNDEENIKVTLLEGSVQVSVPSVKSSVPSVVKIKPGEQAVVTQNSELRTNSSPDLDAVMAWKNGYFQFNRSSLQEVMRQIERWYDVEVVYEGSPAPMEFGGKITRTSSAAEVLKILALSKVNFRIEGKRIVVLK